MVNIKMRERDERINWRGKKDRGKNDETSRSKEKKIGTKIGK